MDQIRKQVDRARRRLWLELFLSRLIKCCFVTLLVAVIAIAVPRLVAIENLAPQWDAWWLGGAAALGALVALGWTLVRGRSELEAAIEIDRRFDLKERVASSLSLPAEAIETPAGRALVSDAERAIKRLEIDERFRIQLGRGAWLPLAPAIVAVAIVALFDNQQAQSSLNPTAALTPKALANTTEPARKKLSEIAKKAPPKKGLEEAKALILEIEKELAKLAEKKQVNRQQALVKFNNLAKQLAERRERLGGENELRRQLAGMKDMARGPADKMVNAMKSGEWEVAKQELQKLQQQLNTSKLDAATQKQLAKQLQKLEQQLAKASAERRQAMEDLQKQIEEQKKQGKLAEAGDLQQKLDRMMRQEKQAKQLEKMAQQLAQAQQNLQNGDQRAASESMAQMMQQLEQMQGELDQNALESQMLDMAMRQLEMSTEAMSCESCMGEGCPDCQGGNMAQNRMGRGGNGLGAAEGGFGDRPEERTDTAFRDSQVKQNTRRGAAVITGEADGPTIRGDVREAIREEVAAAEAAEDEALVIEQLPRTQRENAEDYFSRLRDGE
jgi:hypothetical protein